MLNTDYNTDSDNSSSSEELYETFYDSETNNYFSILEKFTMPNPENLRSSKTKHGSTSTNENEGMSNKTANNGNLNKPDEVLSQILAKINSMSDTMNEIKTDISSIHKKMDNYETRFTTLETENEALKESLLKNSDELYSLKLNVDQLKQDKLSDYIAITGPLIPTENSNLNSKMSALLSSSLNLDKAKLSTYEYRLINSTKPFITVKVPLYHDRATIFAAARKYKPNNLFINESLTERRFKLLMEIKKRNKQDNKFKSVFALNGNVYVTLHSDGKRVLIRDTSDLLTLA